MSLNSFYPLSETIKKSALWQVSMIIKIEGHLRNARNGDGEAESKLCNRIGQIRRHVKHVDHREPDLMGLVKESVDWLRSQGRKINLHSEDPREWISTRDGRSRW